MIHWGAVIRRLGERYTQQEIEKMTLYYALVQSGVVLCPEDGKVRLTPEEMARYYG